MRRPARVTAIICRLRAEALSAALELGQGLGGQRAAMQGAEILGGDGHAGNITQVAVDVVGAQNARLAVVTMIHQQALAADRLDPRDRLGEPRIAKAIFGALAALRRKAGGDQVAIDEDIAGVERAGAACAVRIEIALATDPHGSAID